MTLFLCGDVMTGRGVDQILHHPGDPALLEPYVRDARTYVRLAEEVHGPVPQPVDASWVWGDVLDVLAEAAPDVRLVNLETALTRDGESPPARRCTTGVTASAIVPDTDDASIDVPAPSSRTPVTDIRADRPGQLMTRNMRQ